MTKVESEYRKRQMAMLFYSILNDFESQLTCFVG